MTPCAAASRLRLAKAMAQHSCVSACSIVAMRSKAGRTSAECSDSRAWLLRLSAATTDATDFHVGGQEAREVGGLGLPAPQGDAADRRPGMLHDALVPAPDERLETADDVLARQCVHGAAGAGKVAQDCGAAALLAK
eukprot:scaffold1596_cov302-Pinguiococcus_pyrenoidosus.AAC.51